MQPGDTVRTFTGKTGKPIEFLPDGKARVEIVARPPDERTVSPRPITVRMIYLRDDLTPVEEPDAHA